MIRLCVCHNVCDVTSWPLRYGEAAWLCEGWTITDCVDDEIKGAVGKQIMQRELQNIGEKSCVS